MAKIILGICLNCGKRGLVVKELCDPPRYYSECCKQERPAKKCEELLVEIRRFRDRMGHLPTYIRAKA